MVCLLGVNGLGVLGVLLALPLFTLCMVMHEWAHASMGRFFGLNPRIDLLGFGGITTFINPGKRLPVHQRLWIAFAGPVLGILLGLIIVALQMLQRPVEGSVLEGLFQLATLGTLGWGIIQLLPILPMDGGYAMSALFERVWGYKPGIKYSHLASIAIILILGTLALALLGANGFGMLLLGAFLLFQNIQSLKAHEYYWERMPLSKDIEQGWKLLEEHKHKELRTVAELIAARAATEDERYQASHLLSWSRLFANEVHEARIALENIPQGKKVDAFLEAALCVAEKKYDVALYPVMESFSQRVRDGVQDDVVALHVGAVLGRVSHDEFMKEQARLLGWVEDKTLEPNLFRIMVHEFRKAGKLQEAYWLQSHLYDRTKASEDAYNAGCLASLLKQTEDGMGWIGIIKDSEWMREINLEPDFAFLRAQPAYAQAMSL